MKPDTNPFFAILLVSAVAVWLVIRFKNAEDLASKRGALAAAFGVAAFVPALLGPSFRDAGQAWGLAACGILTLLLAITAVGLAVAAIIALRRAGGGSRGYIVLALLCGAATLFCGTGLFLGGLVTRIDSVENSSTWRSSEFVF